MQSVDGVSEFAWEFIQYHPVRVHTLNICSKAVGEEEPLYHCWFLEINVVSDTASVSSVDLL